MATHMKRLGLLGEMVPCAGSVPLVFKETVAYPRYWQVPAATEKAAFEAVLPRDGSLGFIYIGFPWATVIDGIRNEAANFHELMRALKNIRDVLPGLPKSRIATVAQHIHADRFSDIFRASGVTDVFWSHARRSMKDIGGLAIHPFPLFPAQTPMGLEDIDIFRPRRYIANFIGAFNPKAYLTDVRDHIFRDAGAEDLLIIKRVDWHFERAVYSEQMKGVLPDQARLAQEAAQKEEYLQAIRDSVFTLCPTGSGPNSIRIGESLALGSIPIILTRDLALPGNVALWESCCLFEEDNVDGYRRALALARAMPDEEIKRRQMATKDLFAEVGSSAYASLIISAMARPESERHAA